MDTCIDSLNLILKNNYFKNILFMISGVFMGYTLQPVPEWLNHLFNTSFLFKFIILFFTSASTFCPLNKNETIIAFISSGITLILFELARDKKTEDKMMKILNKKDS